MSEGATSGRRLSPFRAGDAIRGVGSLLVIAAHVAYYTFLGTGGGQTGQAGFDKAYGPTGGFLIDSGLFALWTFFALSGFLITWPFVNAIVNRDRAPRLRSYARNRLLRIVPVFWVVFTVLMLRFGIGDSDAGDIAWVYGFMQVGHDSHVAHLVGQAWSLDVEFAFYVAVPIVAFAAAPLFRLPGTAMRRAGAILAGLALLWALSIALRTWSADNFTERAALPAIMFAFLPGIALAAIEAGGGEAFFKARDRLARRVSLVLAAVGLACLALYSVGAGEPVGKRAVLISVGAGALLGAPMVNQWAGRPRWRVIENRPLSWIGERSFSIYLLHIWMIFEVERLVTHRIADPGPRFFAALALVVPISLLVAHLSYEVIEKPALKLKGRRQRPEGARAGTA